MLRNAKIRSKNSLKVSDLFGWSSVDLKGQKETIEIISVDAIWCNKNELRLLGIGCEPSRNNGVCMKFDEPTFHVMANQ